MASSSTAAGLSAAFRTRKRRPWTVLLAAACLWIPSAARAEYREVEVHDGGRISGRVIFQGKLPEGATENFPVSGKWPGCGTGLRSVIHVDVKNGALRGTFVLLDGITQGKKWPAQRSPAMLDQRACKFLPSHQIIRSGTPLVLRNSDSGVLHTVNMRESAQLASGREVLRVMFNLAQPNVGDLSREVKPKSSPFITVGCELHNFMVAHILSPEHPYAALVKPDGTFELDQVPPGEYSLIAWHPKLGKQKLAVTVPPKGKAEASFKFGE